MLMNDTLSNLLEVHVRQNPDARRNTLRELFVNSHIFDVRKQSPQLNVVLVNALKNKNKNYMHIKDQIKSRNIFDDFYRCSPTCSASEDGTALTQ